MASLVELKAAARRLLKPDSALRNLILSEPDYMPREQASAKISVFARLMHHELGPN
jgi:hypothetical protein